jgi:AAA domain
MLADQVFSWLSVQPEWQQDLARRLTTRVQLDPEEYDEAVRMVRSHFGLSITRPAPPPRPIVREDIAAEANSPPVRLRALSHVHGVGLLAATETLRFSPAGLTIIYGQNAAGKSTYVGALKVLCRTVDRSSTVRSNVFADPLEGPSSATVTTELDGVVEDRITSLERSPGASLTGMSVFDAGCAELYVDAQNSVQYIPPELRLLTRLGALQDRIRKELAEERESLTAREASVASYPESTTVGQALRLLKGREDDPDLASLATLSGQEVKRIGELSGIIASVGAPSARTDALAARREATEARELVESLADLARRTRDPAVQVLRESARLNHDAKGAVAVAAAQLAGRLPGIGGGPWRIMWEAARNYIEANEGRFPPGIDSACPLCLQPITGETATRMAHFEAHVSSTVQETSRNAAATLAAALSACSPEHALACRTALVEVLREQAPELGHQIETFIDAIAAHLTSMANDPISAIVEDFDAQPIATALNAWADGRADRASALIAAEDPAGLERTRTELAELEARQRLSGELATFESRRADLSDIAALTEAHSALATNRITIEQRTLTKTEVAKALDASLTEELRRLKCSHLPVHLSAHTQVAETTVRLTLLSNQTVALSEILSEGERRALALSFFLAELTTANDTGGIIVDDPVSSLDDSRRQYIAHRLAVEACRRQVIVFTHDLPFVFELRAKARRENIPVHVQHVWRDRKHVGRVDDHPPFKTMNLRERVSRLESEVVAMKSAPVASTHEDASGAVEGFYKRVRTTWERAVEERLFAGVVERFERDVKTKSLKDVKITPERVKHVESGMARASTFIHEEPYAAQEPIPSIAEMEQDVADLRAFEKQTRIG